MKNNLINTFYSILVIILIDNRGISLLIVGNIVFAGLFFFTIYSLESLDVPIFDIKIKVLEVTSEDVTLQAIVNVSNTNSYDLFIEDLKVVSYNIKGERLGTIDFPSKIVKSFERTSLISIEKFSIDSIGTIKNEVFGRFGFSIFSLFKKILPIHFFITTVIPESIQNLSLPMVSSSFSIQDFNDAGIQFTGEINFDNQDNFEISIYNISIHLINGIGQISVENGIIPPKGSLTIPVNGYIGYDIMDEGIENIIIHGLYKIRVAGVSVVIPFNIETKMEMPSLAEIFFNNSSGGITLNGDIKFILKGMLATVELGITNPTSINFYLTNISWIMWRVDGDIKREIGSGTTDNCDILPREDTWIKTDIVIPYKQLLPRMGEHLLPDSFEITFKGLISIKGSNQYLPIFLTGSI